MFCHTVRDNKFDYLVVAFPAFEEPLALSDAETSRLRLHLVGAQGFFVFSFLWNSQSARTAAEVGQFLSAFLSVCIGNPRR